MAFLAAQLERLQAILVVALGLGFVIFIHELGHFLLAKWNGVKVLKFSIGFGPALLKIRRGETEYALSALPLGGYVKMLGEAMEDDAKTDDPRAFANRPVLGRMAIIAAGVLMNLAFGVCCFTIVSMRGTYENPPILGGVVAGSPAYKAGLRAGDEVVSLDGSREFSYGELARTVALSGAGRSIRLVVRRPGVEAPIAIEVAPARATGDPNPTIGINSAADLTLDEDMPFRAPPGMAGGAAVKWPKGANRVLAVGPAGGPSRPLAEAEDLDRELARLRGVPVEFTAGPAPAEPGAEPTKTADGPVKVVVPPNRVVDLGMRLTPGPILAFRPGSPGEKAGLRVGDTVVAVDGREDYDPMRLPSLAADAADAGRDLELRVSRADGAGKASAATLRVRPDGSPPWPEPVRPREPLSVPGLGLAMTVLPRVAGVDPGGPADRAKIRPGALLRSVTLSLPAAEGRKATSSTIPLDEKQPNWPSFFGMTLQSLNAVPTGDAERDKSLATLTLSVADSESPLTVVPRVVPDWFNPSRGLAQTALVRRVPPQGVGPAIRRGARETVDSALSIYASIRGLFQSRLSPSNFGGPLPIADMAYKAARAGLDTFLPFLGMLSVNLAVINFLPIFPLDGGQMIFLLAELVRGKPLPDKAMLPFQVVGLVFVLGLIVVVCIKDILGYLF